MKLFSLFPSYRRLLVENAALRADMATLAANLSEAEKEVDVMEAFLSEEEGFRQEQRERFQACIAELTTHWTEQLKAVKDEARRAELAAQIREHAARALRMATENPDPESNVVRLFKRRPKP